MLSNRFYNVCLYACLSVQYEHTYLNLNMYLYNAQIKLISNLYVMLRQVDLSETYKIYKY